jgi:predicted O-methyltransferase YrrM
MRFRVFNEINRRYRFNNFIETGTYLGMTTRFLSHVALKNDAQVFSCEINDEYLKVAKRTVGHLRNIHLHHSNSVDFISALSSKVSDDINFVYLDAHWYDYLPLRDELSLLMNWRNTIVMIDDFRVPFDDRFGWDKYDEEHEICLRYVDTVIAEKPIFFPGYPARSEGAVARGYCVIPMSDSVLTELECIALLRKLPSRA